MSISVHHFLFFIGSPILIRMFLDESGKVFCRSDTALALYSIVVVQMSNVFFKKEVSSVVLQNVFLRRWKETQKSNVSID